MDAPMSDTMNNLIEHPAKRARLSYISGSPEEVGEASEEWDLHAARAQNDLRLKSIFEGIFSKYGNDFSEVGDEIDLETGEIVVNNGHLQGLHDEADAGNEEQAWLLETDPATSEDEVQDGDEELVGAQGAASGRNSQRELLGSGTDGDANVSLCDAALTSLEPGPGIPGSSRSVFGEPSSAPHHIEKDPGPKDPVWQAPDLPPLFSTPKVQRRTDLSPQLPNLHRELSPPGSGSLWTVPRRGRPRKSQDGTARTTPTPSKRRPRAKRKAQSSPVSRDWSFAKVADGSESDDPLQENWPSLMPFTPQMKATEKRRCGGPVKPVDDSVEDAVISRVGATPQSSIQAGRTMHRQSATEPKPDSRGHHSEQSPAQSDVAIDYDNVQSDSSPRLPPHSQAVADSPLTNTPTGSNARISPDEARLIVRMRYVQGRKWKEILDALPGRKMTQIYQWNQIHWVNRRVNPPEPSPPWLQAELETLESLADRSGLSWVEIKAQLPGRSRPEIEVELLRIWVGEDVWGGGQRAAASVQNEVEHEAIGLDTDDRERNGLETSAMAVEESTVEDPTAVEGSDMELPAPGAQRPLRFEELINDDGENDDDADDDEVILISGVSSPSKLSAIHLESPVPSRHGSATLKSPTKLHSLI
ncbi:uncharacterized protein N7482_008920 [Penicillium canariense]|uniref:Myb-like DNA-binding domain protein n=1 Tax=Penicillium canariense TaxID=189055 RepID=A0A9W9HWW4_9EURO|nr:uncharacterized protein N7482_008920 [Penicillium canariense]KAJ5157820.1 hypothetical protein N7482_008920 [Penicillium canariense]